MKKIKTVFRIDRDAGLATDEVMPESAWVLAGEGIATIKHDGTAAMVRGGKLYKRFDRKLDDRHAKLFRKGKIGVIEEHMLRPAREGWEACEPAPDAKTGHWPGWLPVTDAPEDIWFREAFGDGGLPEGTYELVGPRISSTTHAWVNGRFERVGSVTNRYGLERHELWHHGNVVVEVTRTFNGIRDWLAANVVEGVVFHHPDGRMAKIRRKDFGLDW